MKVAGHNRQVDYRKLGPSMLIASCVVMAIRTAKWIPSSVETASERDWDTEVDRSVKIAQRILSHLTSKHPGLFAQQEVPWYQPSEEESPR